VPALVTNNFRIHNSKQFREMLSEASLIGGTGISSAEETALSTHVYLFIGKSDSWSGSFSDTSVPDPSTAANPSSDTTGNTHYSHWTDMIAAKKVAASDVSHVITRHNWTTGRHYSMYKDTETFSNLISTRTSQTLANTSGTGTATATLYPMYVMNSTYGVYKCLYNSEVEISGTNYPQVSTVEPTATTTTAGAPAALADGYIWKYMYTITASEALKFVTTSYIPVKQLRDANAYGNTATSGGMTSGTGAKNDGSDQAAIELAAIDGALDVFVINVDGTGYTFENNRVVTNSSESVTLTMATPTLTSDDKYNNSSIYFTFSGTTYVRKIVDCSFGSSVQTLTLDSTVPALSGTITANVAPFARVNGDGHGAEIVLTANSDGTGSEVGGVTVVSTGNSYTTATLIVEQQGTGAGTLADITPILPPKGGHGYDPVSELGGYFVMVNSKLTQDESGAFTTTNDFRKIGLLTDPNTDGVYTRYTSDTATQSKTFTYTTNTAAISGDITITQEVGANGATAYVVDVNSSAKTIRVVNITNGANASAGYDGKPGSWQCTTTNVASSTTGVTNTIATFTYTGGSAVLTDVANGSMQIGSGNIIYVENRAPVARASDQTEDIKLIIEF